MKRRFALIAIMIVNLLIVSALGACTPEKPPEPGPEHQHTYSNEWSSDRNNHWHNATCEHTDLKQDEAPHSFDDNFKCQICGFTLTETSGLWHEENDDGTWKITGVDRYQSETVIIIPEQYDGKDVTIIGEGAFQNRTSMTDIVLPDTIKTIEAYAFQGCDGLTEVTIPDSVTYIGNDAFNGCEELQLLTMGDSVSEVYSDAFKDCKKLSMVDVGFLSNWCLINFENIEANPLSNGGSIYEDGVPMNSLTLPNTISKIEKFAFYGSKITDVTIPEKTDYIGTDAFGKCDLLNDVNYLGEIPDWCIITFDNTYANPISIAHNFKVKGIPITDLDIPGTVSEIGEYAFYGLNMTSLTLNPGITSIKSNAFRNCLGFTSLNIPRTIKDIGDFAFTGCSDLKDLTLNDGLSTIGSGSFKDCILLYKAEIPDSVNLIKGNAFNNCINLTELTIGKDVTTIETSAFEGCFKLIEVRNLSENISLTMGTLSNGSAAYYAHNVYSDQNDRNIIYDGDYLFYCSDTENYFLEYIGDNAKITLPENISENRYGIYQYAFSYNATLTDISIPETILSIGKNAFDNCKNLKFNSEGNIQYLGNSDNPYLVLIKADENVVKCDIKDKTKFITSYAFSGCVSLTDVKFSDSIINLGENAFEGCTALQNVTLSESLSSISNYAFYNCSSLQGIEFPKSVKEIGDFSFANCTEISKLIIPDTVEKMSSSSFAYCNITDLSIGTEFLNCVSLKPVIKLNITKGSVIENELFMDLDNLQEVRLCNGIIEIGDQAFYGCIALPQISLPDTVEKIGSSAFYNCRLLSSISLPDSITSMGDGIFEGCENLKGYIHDNIEYLGNSGNEYLYLYNVNDKSIKKYESNPKTKFIYDNAFKDCAELTDVTIGNEVLYMGNNVFQNCSVLNKVEIGSGLQALKNYAFAGCVSLQTIDISKSVESIGNYAFSGCTKLQEIALSSDLNYFGSNVFQNCNKLQYYKDEKNSYLGNPTNNFIVLMKTIGMETYDVKDGTRVIYDSAFVGSTCSQVTLPESIRVISDKAFNGTFLTEINLPEGLVKVGSQAFYGTKLTKFILPDSCIELGFKAIGKCNSLKVVYFGGVKSYVCGPIADNSVTLQTAGGWFDGSISRIEEVYMPCIEEIEEYAFYQCRYIRKIVVGKNLKEICRYAFEFASGFSVYYEGTETQWDNIVKGRDWDWSTRPSFHYEQDVNSMRPEV